MQKRAAIWTAVSSKAQAKDEKVSLDVQKQAGQAKANDLGYTVVEVLTVPGKSRNIILFEDATKEIPAYARLRELVDRREIDLLIFYNKSRLARTLALGETIVAYCQAQDVAVYDLAAPPSTLEARKQKRSSGDVLIGAVTSATAQNDNTQRVIAQEAGMIGKIENGDMPMKAPFGYRRVYEPDGKFNIEIDERSAAIIRKIFELYLDGNGRIHICQHLNESGMKPPEGGLWTHGNLMHIFRRIWVYAGYVEFNRNSKVRATVRSKGKHKAIISEEILHRVLTEKKERAQARRSVGKGARSLSRVVFCKPCAHFMRCDFSRDYPNMRCEKCKRTVAASKIIGALHSAFDAMIAGEYKVEISREVDTSNFENEIIRLDGERGEISKSLDRAHRALTDGLMPYEAYKKQVTRLQESAQLIERALKAAQAHLISLRTRQQRRKEMPSIAEMAEIAKEMLGAENEQAVNSWLREWIGITFDEERKIVVTPKWLKDI